ncbi:hypothetical protein BGX34_010481 [Mortierella sp. NVP85]|nr:hypothetical protein BGX34_010481 [Mortierella sp. NVP85]
MDLAKTFPSLVKLDLDFVQIESIFWEALSTHHHIRSMRLWCIEVGTDDTPRLWDVCKRLESLELSRVTIEGGGVSKDAVFDRLRELIIWEVSELDVRSQMDLIIQCPMLECLEWDFDGWMSLSGSRLINHPLQNHWPYLNKLHINCNLLDLEMALILQSVGTGHGNIVDLQIGSCQLETQASKALGLHFNTLVRVDFARFHHASSSIILDILCSCPRLEVLRAKNVSAKDIAEHGPWVCQHLRELEICFHVGDSDQDLQPLIFKRLSTLVRLKHLKLNSFLRSVITDSVLEFRLECGMGQLSTLQQLASLAFGVHSRNMRYFPQLGMDEATWIMDNWKNLKLIKGRLNKDQEIDIQLKSAFKSHGINTS